MQCCRQINSATVCFDNIDMLHVNALSSVVHGKMWFTRVFLRRSMPKVPLVASLWTFATCAMSPLTLCSKLLLLKVFCVLLDILCCHDAAREVVFLLFLPSRLAVEQQDHSWLCIRGRYSCQTSTVLSGPTDTLTRDPVIHAKRLRHLVSC